MYTCVRTDFYKAKFVGYDHKGNVFQRLYMFTCGGMLILFLAHYANFFLNLALYSNFSFLATCLVIFFPFNSNYSALGTLRSNLLNFGIICKFSIILSILHKFFYFWHYLQNCFAFAILFKEILFLAHYANFSSVLAFYANFY